jgi:uncharacterized protein YegJ (DUF2314 family)
MKRLLKPPGGEATAWSVVLLLSGIFLLAAAVKEIHLFAIAAGISLVVAGAGIWRRKQWGAWVGAAQMLASAVYAGFRFSTDGFLWSRLLIVVAAPYCAWIISNLKFRRESVVETDDEDDSEELMVSLVALLPDLPYFDASILARLAGEAWGILVGTEDEEEETAFIVGESPHFLAKFENYFFAIHYVDTPYFESPEEITDYAPDSRIQHAILNHEAWISIDLLQADDEKEEHARKQEAYRLLGKLLAELIDVYCLAIFCPETGSIFAYHPSFQEKLTGEDPFKQLLDMEYPPVIEVNADDPRMKAAVDKARSHWPEFVTGFENRSNEQTFSVKTPLRDGKEREYIWINVTAIENNIIYGKLGNEPVNLPRFKLDDTVRVPVQELNDWIYTTGDDFHGGFTLEVLTQTAKEKSKRGRTIN